MQMDASSTHQWVCVREQHRPMHLGDTRREGSHDSKGISDHTVVPTVRISQLAEHMANAGSLTALCSARRNIPHHRSMGD